MEKTLLNTEPNRGIVGRLFSFKPFGRKSLDLGPARRAHAAAEPRALEGGGRSAEA
jgi:hypothetical protein